MVILGLSRIRTLLVAPLLFGLASCALAPGGTVGTTREDVAATVVINEFTPGSSGWIELYNPGSVAVDVSNWSVDDVAGGGYAPKSLGSSVSIPAQGYLVVSYAGINYASTDSVRLVDASGTEVDSHSNFYAKTSTAGLCFGRQPDGGAWAAANLICSKGVSNGGGCASCDDANTCTTDACAGGACSHTPVADGTSCGTGLACTAGMCGPIDECTVTNGAVITSTGTSGAVLLQGMVVTPDEAFAGEVLVVGDSIVCVAASCESDPNAAAATVVNTNGIILPGMIDAHNHVLFDIFDEGDWSPTQSYTNHNQWPNDPRYKALVNAKQYLNGEAGSPVDYGCEMDKYGELKGLISGTTSIQGSANPANRACFGSLARTIDQTPNGLGSDHVQTATIFPSTSAADGVCKNFSSGTTEAYVIHVAEGVDATALKEFGKLGTVTSTDDCLYAPQTTIIHGTALGDAEFDVMSTSGMSLVWSPRSNVFLYGAGTDYTKTTNIPLALSHGINVSVGPDWSIGGSQNLLDELPFAKLVDSTVFGNILTSQALVQMVTSHPAKALGLGTVLGSLAPGFKADLFVIGGDTTAPFDAVLASTARDVRLVMVGGVVLYGDPALQPLAPASPGCETFDACCRSKFVCVASTGGTASNKFGQTLSDIESTLASASDAYDDLHLTEWSFSPIAPILKCK